MKDRPTVSLWSDILAAMQGELGSITGAATQGIFIGFEGGEVEGCGAKSSASRPRQEVKKRPEMDGLAACF
jgi:hypothetical protein